MTDRPPLRIYGVPFSQPVRAVLWVLLHQGLPFELVPVNPGSAGANGSRNPEFLARNPAGTIPTLEEPDTGFTLGEAHAILTYLAQREGWTELYPEDLQRRARVDAYLHFHHRNVREASVGLVAPRIRKDLDIPEVFQRMAEASFRRALSALNDGWIGAGRHLVGDDLTLADFAAYVEIGQLRAGFTNLFDFAEYPNVARWLDTMAAVDGHDVVHEALSVLGDVSVEAPTMERIKEANQAGFVAVARRLAGA